MSYKPIYRIENEGDATPIKTVGCSVSNGSELMVSMLDNGNAMLHAIDKDGGNQVFHITKETCLCLAVLLNYKNKHCPIDYDLESLAKMEVSEFYNVEYDDNEND